MFLIICLSFFISLFFIMIILYSVYYKTLPNRIDADEKKVEFYDCKKSRYGCCNDGETTKLDEAGHNCIKGKPIPPIR